MQWCVKCNLDKNRCMNSWCMWIIFDKIHTSPGIMIALRQIITNNFLPFESKTDCITVAAWRSLPKAWGCNLADSVFQTCKDGTILQLLRPVLAHQLLLSQHLATSVLQLWSISFCIFENESWKMPFRIPGKSRKQLATRKTWYSYERNPFICAANLPSWQI